MAMEQAGITLTPHQQEAVDWLVTRILAGDKLSALRGLAGTGKTTLIPALRAALAAQDIETFVGSPTHRAAMILRKKGLADADTVHAHALTPYFTADYRRACAWLGEDLPGKLEDTDGHEDIDGMPWLIHEAVKPDVSKAKNLRRHRGRYKAKRLLASIGIHGKDHFAGFGPKEGPGVLIIDEASMVGQKMLAICQEAFQQIILVGDPGQLPPVKDAAMLVEVEGIDLTEIHRQASDSPIVQLAYRARQGESFWQKPLSDPLGDNKIVTEKGTLARRFLTSPLLVWRNSTRIQCTHDIRKALGYDRDTLQKGEPLVCRSTSQEDRALGFYNNGLYTITDVSPDDPRFATVEDALGTAMSVYVHLEELDGDHIDPRAVPFRFGYCLTAHTAQGGEWPRVYVSMPDLLKYAAFCQGAHKTEEIAQWTYTVITRAKETLAFLSVHAFFAAEEKVMAPKIAPPSSPMLGNSVQDASDDIADPAIPPPLEAALTTMEASLKDKATPEMPPPLPAHFGEHEALLQGFCQHLLHRLETQGQEYYRAGSKAIDQVWHTTKEFVESLRGQNEHALYQFSDTLLKMQEQGISLRHDPYTAELRLLSPNGFSVLIRIAKPSQQDLLAELKELTDWCANVGCKPA